MPEPDGGPPKPYAFMRDTLKALPKEKQRLAGGVLWSADLGCGCATGTVIPDALWAGYVYSVLSGSSGFVNPEVEAWCTARGLTSSVLHSTMDCNDRLGCYETPRQRYKRVLAWLEQKAEEEVEEEEGEEGAITAKEMGENAGTTPP